MRYRSYSNGGNFFGMGLLFFFMFGGFKTVFLLLPLFLYFLPIILAVYFGLKLLRAITGNMRLNKNTKNQSFCFKEILFLIQKMQNHIYI